MKTNKIVLSGLGIATVFLMTVIVVIPISGMGYINVGDASLMLFSSVVTPSMGFLIGGVGSALADLYLGYSQYALFTLIVKGLEGLLVVVLIRKLNFIPYVALALGALLMVCGYYFADGIILGSFSASFAGVPANILQGTCSVIIASLAYKPFQKVAKNNKIVLN